jgi:FKBP-type peptidyl-prolyl cis-trans isomerase
MKQFLFFLGFSVLLTGVFTSCKENTALDKYVNTNSLTGAKDASGIYFKLTERSADTTLIRSGFKVMLEFNITLIDGKTVIFSTEDEYGHNYEPFAFYVDVSNDIVNASYVQQISGLHLGLKKMHIGDRALIVIPSELAFKAVDNTALLGIPRFSTLVATVYAKKGYSPAQQK